ncbi:MAG TPA: hypothetical protein VI318_06630 [Baekduia sp.]
MPLYLIRGLVALAWAAGFAAVSDSLTAGTGAFLVVYPGIDLVASLVDARRQTGPARSLLRFDAGVSAVAAVGLAIAATGNVADVLVVWGAWATVTGVAQVVVALQRRAVLGNQWPMLVAGGLSTLVGFFYVGQALGDDPKLSVLSVYAAGGGAFFVIQSALLVRRERRAAAAAQVA